MNKQQLITILLKIPGNQEVEFHDMSEDRTLQIDKVELVQEYDFACATCHRPTILLTGSE